MNKELSNFRDAMSLVPTCVSILSCIQNNSIYGCTISSLVSVNINEKSPEILFVLKNESSIGDKIKLGNLFSINILADNQMALAKKYSQKREPDSLSDQTWNISDGFPKIQGARIHLECELASVYESHAANIFVGSINKYFGDLTKSALIYDARNYGRFNTLN